MCTVSEMKHFVGYSHPLARAFKTFRKHVEKNTNLNINLTILEYMI